MYDANIKLPESARRTYERFASAFPNDPHKPPTKKAVQRLERTRAPPGPALHPRAVPAPVPPAAPVPAPEVPANIRTHPGPADRAHRAHREASQAAGAVRARADPCAVPSCASGRRRRDEIP
ncbi:MAG: hypothetical protein U1F77_09495 [Kiritimatiellia bacterium]